MSHTLRVLSLALLAIGFTLVNAFVHYEQGSLSYDEGDYYQAVLKGFGVNWTDADDVPIGEFIGTGVKGVKGEIPRSELSRQIRSANSTAFLRHYHPPVALYPPIILHTVAPNLPEEDQLRLGTFALLILWIAFLAFLALRYPDSFSPWFLLIPASANWIASASGFNMHITFGLAATTFALLWYAYEKRRDQRAFKQMGLFFLAVALCSVEYSLFLLGFLSLWNVVTLWRKKKGERRAFLRTRGIDFLWLVGFMALLWPAGIFKLGLLKSYALQTYIALFRLEEVVSTFPTFWTMIRVKWSNSPLELIVLVAAFLAIFRCRRDLLRRGSLFVTLGLLLAISYTQMNPVLNLRWYLFPVFALVFAFFLHVLSEQFRLSPGRESLIALVLGVLFFVSAQFLVELPVSTTSRDLRDIIIAQRPLPIVSIQDMAPRLGAYFPYRNVRGLHPTDLESGKMRDSLTIWGRNRILVLPRDIKVEGRMVGTVDGLVVYVPRR